MLGHPCNGVALLRVPKRRPARPMREPVNADPLAEYRPASRTGPFGVAAHEHHPFGPTLALLTFGRPRLFGLCGANVASSRFFYQPVIARECAGSPSGSSCSIKYQRLC